MESKTPREQEFISKGLVDQLPQSLFQKNRTQFISMFKKSIGSDLPSGAVALFSGATEMPLGSSDCSYPEYQEAFFYYLFGAAEMDCFGAIDFVNEKAVLFVPRQDEFYKIWMTVLSLDEYKEKYNLVD